MSTLSLSFVSNGGLNPSVTFEFPNSKDAYLFFGRSCKGTIVRIRSETKFEKVLPFGKFWLLYTIPLSETHFGQALGYDVGLNSFVVRCVCLRLRKNRQKANSFFRFLEKFGFKDEDEQKSSEKSGYLFFETRKILDFLNMDGMVLLDKNAYQLPEKVFQTLFPCARR